MSSGLQQGPLVQMMPPSTLVTLRSGSSRHRPQMVSSSLSSMPPAKKRPRRSHLPSLSRVRGCSGSTLVISSNLRLVVVEEVEPVVERHHRAAAGTERHRADIVLAERPVLDLAAAWGPCARARACRPGGRCRPPSRASLRPRPTPGLRPRWFSQSRMHSILMLMRVAPSFARWWRRRAGCARPSIASGRRRG